jgi:hypothetical protein
MREKDFGAEIGEALLTPTDESPLDELESTLG